MRLRLQGGGLTRGAAGLKRSDKQGGQNDVFSQMFGGMFGQRRGGRESGEAPKGPAVETDIQVTLEQIYVGDFIEFLRAKPVPKQAPGERDCNCRNEMRTVQSGRGMVQMQQVRRCDKCPNVKFEMEYTEIDVEIEVGMADGHVITFPGEGEPHIDGEPGDLRLRVLCEKHAVFARRGPDVRRPAAPRPAPPLTAPAAPDQHHHHPGRGAARV